MDKTGGNCDGNWKYLSLLFWLKSLDNEIYILLISLIDAFEKSFRTAADHFVPLKLNLTNLNFVSQFLNSNKNI